LAPTTVSYYQCKCHPENVMYPDYDVCQKSVRRPYHWNSRSFTCPRQCGALLILHSYPVENMHPSDGLKCINKRLTKNCHACNRTGQEKFVTKQTFYTCTVCSGTGGLRCPKHHTSQRVHDYDYGYDYDFVTSSQTCTHCGSCDVVGFIKRCQHCNGIGQFCDEMNDVRPCSKCVNVKCRDFFKSEKAKEFCELTFTLSSSSSIKSQND
jgi:hypothetical protein